MIVMVEVDVVDVKVVEGKPTTTRAARDPKVINFHEQDDGKGKGDGSSEDKRAASMSTAKKEDESARDLESRGSEQPTTGSTGETTATAGESALLTEVTSLLRSLRSSGQGSGQRGPAVRVAYVKKLDPTENTSYLLDGGATHPLRQCRNRAEWNAATPTVVNLALGEATLRQKENGTLLTEEHVQPIIPVQEFDSMIGVKVTWVDGVCRMMLQGSKLGVYMDQGCPCVGAVEGKRLMEQVEEMHTIDEQRCEVCEIGQERMTHQRTRGVCGSSSTSSRTSRSTSRRR